MRRWQRLLVALTLALSVCRPAAAAIAFDTATDGSFTLGATSISWSHTCTGANGFLVVGVTASGGVITATYNGTSMTSAGAGISDGVGDSVYSFYLFGPATGAHTLQVNSTASVIIAAVAASYTGVDSGGLDAAAVGGSGGTTAYTQNITTVTTNAWVVATASHYNTIAAGTGTTSRQVGGFTSDSLVGDNGPVSPPASTAMQVTSGISNGFVMWQLALKPSGGATAPTRTLIGVGR